MRKCGDCNQCCITYAIDELNKAVHSPCSNLCSKGCSVYKKRPKVCKEYLCAWRESKTLTEDERPDKLGAIFRFRTGDGRGAGFRKCLDVVAERGGLDEGTKAREVADRLAKSIPVIVISKGITIGPWDENGHLLLTAKYVQNPRKAERIKPPKRSESAQMRAIDELLNGVI